MSKDVFWFKHDSNAHRDIKIKKLIHLHGYWGYGIFWAVIEALREQDGYTWENDDSGLQMLCDVIGCKDEAKFLTWYRDCIKYGLLVEDGKVFYSNSLMSRMEVWETKKENGKKGGRPKKENRTETEQITELKPDGNHKRREEKIRKEESVPKLSRQDYEYLQRETKFDLPTVQLKTKKALMNYHGRNGEYPNKPVSYALSWMLGDLDKQNGKDEAEKKTYTPPNKTF